MSRKRILIVMAAGSGVRMGATVPKQFLDLEVSRFSAGRSKRSFPLSRTSR